MQILELAKEIAALEGAARKFYKLRYQMNNGGNLSIRVPDKDWMIVKGTNVSFEEVCIDNLVITDFDGNVIEGGIKPSKEALLHGAIYKSRPKAMAIMHCHSPYAVALANKHTEFRFTTYHSTLKLFGKVAVFDTQSYAVPKERFPEILEFLKEDTKYNSFLLKGHGQVTIGANMREAAYLAELVEETAQIALLG